MPDCIHRYDLVRDDVEQDIEGRESLAAGRKIEYILCQYLILHHAEEQDLSCLSVVSVERVAPCEVYKALGSGAPGLRLGKRVQGQGSKYGKEYAPCHARYRPTH